MTTALCGGAKELFAPRYMFNHIDGRLILVDYKTDRITDEERANPALLAARLKERHGHQLTCYANAMMCGKMTVTTLWVSPNMAST